MTTLARKILAEADIRGIHPTADLFPLLSDEELGDLADDIREHGLRQPIITTPDGTLIDGRNRLVACYLAGVEPSYQVYDGDVASFVISLNIYRRNLTQGQRALLVVRADPPKFGDFGKRAEAARSLGVRSDALGNALLIVEFAAEYIDGIIAGETGETGVSFAKALEIARERRAEQRSREERRAADEQAAARRTQVEAAKLAALRARYPDLGRLYDEKQLGSLAEIEAVVAERQEAERRQRAVVTRNFLQALLFLQPAPAGVDRTVVDTVARLDARQVSGMDVFSPNREADFSPARIRACAAVLLGVADALEEEQAS